MSTCDCSQAQGVMNLPCAVQCIVQEQGPTFQNAFNNDLGGVATEVQTQIGKIVTSAQTLLTNVQNNLGDDLVAIDHEFQKISNDVITDVRKIIQESESSINTIIAKETSFLLHLYATDVALVVTAVLMMNLFPSLFRCFPDWMVFSVATAIVLAMPNSYYAQLEQVAVPSMIAALVITIIVNRQKCIINPK